jgi:hypothetical protein
MLVLAHTLQRHSCAMDSVADSGCLIRILIFTQPDPGSRNSNKRGVKKISCQTFFY